MINISTLRRTPAGRQFIKFALVGLVTTAINFMIYAVLVLAGVNYLLSAVIAFIVGTLNSYTFNRTWTFRTGKHQNALLLKFTAVQLLGLAINLGVLALFVEYGGLEDHKLFAQLLANGFVVMSNFFGNKYWTFRS